MLEGGREHAQFSVDVGRHAVLQTGSEPARRLEDRHFVFGGVTAEVLKDVRATIGFVVTDDDQIQIAVAVGVPGDGTRPETGTEVDGEARVVVS